MHKFYKVLMIAVTCVMAAGIVSCQEEEKDGPITVNPSSLEFIAAGGTKTIAVEGLNWEATTNAGWIKLEQSEGIITVTVGKNEAGERSASITVKNSVDTKTVAVTQKAAGPVGGQELSVDPDKLIFAYAGGTETVTVTSDLGWGTVASDEWIVVEEFDDSFTVTVGVNDGSEPREGSVTVDNGEEQATVVIKQATANSVVVDPENLDFTPQGGTKTVTVMSVLDWTATTNDSWITVEESDDSFTVTVGVNATERRTGTVIVGNGEDEVTLGVSQAGVVDIVFPEGDMGFFWDPNNAGTTIFEIDFEDAAGNYLNLSVSTPFIPDMMQAYLPDGTYEYANDYSEFTFEGCPEYGLPEAIYVDSDGIHEVSVVGGEFTSSYLGDWVYSLEFDIELSDGTILKASYEGIMSVWRDTETDVDADFDAIDTAWAETWEVSDIDGLWMFCLYADANSQNRGVYIAINGEHNLRYPPTGHFPMASKARLFEPGTAEPTSMYDNWADIGCINYGMGGIMQYSVPNKGFVDVVKVGDSSYEVTFEFEGPDGHTVTGNYTGYVDGGEPGWGLTQQFTSASATYWGDSGRGSGEYDITFYDNLGGELYIGYLYSELVDGDGDLSVGTYTYANNTNRTAFTFKNMYYDDFQCTGGSFTVARDGSDYVIEFNLQFSDGYSLDATTYRGPIEYN